MELSKLVLFWGTHHGMMVCWGVLGDPSCQLIIGCFAAAPLNSREPSKRCLKLPRKLRTLHQATSVVLFLPYSTTPSTPNMEHDPQTIWAPPAEGCRISWRRNDQPGTHFVAAATAVATRGCSPEGAVLHRQALFSGSGSWIISTMWVEVVFNLLRKPLRPLWL